MRLCPRCKSCEVCGGRGMIPVETGIGLDAESGVDPYFDQSGSTQKMDRNDFKDVFDKSLPTVPPQRMRKRTSSALVPPQAGGHFAGEPKPLVRGLIVAGVLVAACVLAMFKFFAC